MRVWKCVCQKQLSQKTGSGWRNLFSHIKSHHPEWKQSGSVNQNSITTFVGFRSGESSSKVSGPVDNTFGWIEWIVLGMKPFNFVEDPLNCKYSNLKDISTKTVMKYMDRLTKVVEQKIAEKLPDKFALVFLTGGRKQVLTL